MDDVVLQLLHFGAARYNPKKFKPISDVSFGNKPTGGLWTSPVDSEYGWREWCEQESFGNIKQCF